MLQVLENELEPAIKELAACLLYPSSSAGDLDHCLGKFETAIQGVKSLQRSLNTTYEQVRACGDRLLKG